MARLINYFELKQRILEERSQIPTELNVHNNAVRGGIRKALRCLEQCQSVTDMVEVVRCKDCRFGMYAGLGKVMCDVYPIVEKANFYCALGERKDNG